MNIARSCAHVSRTYMYDSLSASMSNDGTDFKHMSFRDNDANSNCARCVRPFDANRKKRAPAAMICCHRPTNNCITHNQAHDKQHKEIKSEFIPLPIEILDIIKTSGSLFKALQTQYSQY